MSVQTIKEFVKSSLNYGIHPDEIFSKLTESHKMLVLNTFVDSSDSVVIAGEIKFVVNPEFFQSTPTRSSKIELIKVLRNYFNWGLVEAKNFVEGQPKRISEVELPHLAKIINDMKCGTLIQVG